MNVELGISIMYITHDLATAYQISENIVVLYRGSVAEAGDVELVVKQPQHSYMTCSSSFHPSPWPAPSGPGPPRLSWAPLGSRPPVVLGASLPTVAHSQHRLAYNRLRHRYSRPIVTEQYPVSCTRALLDFLWKKWCGCLLSQPSYRLWVYPAPR